MNSYKCLILTARRHRKRYLCNFYTLVVIQQYGAISFSSAIRLSNGHTVQKTWFSFFIQIICLLKSCGNIKFPLYSRGTVMRITAWGYLSQTIEYNSILREGKATIKMGNSQYTLLKAQIDNKRFMKSSSNQRIRACFLGYVVINEGTSKNTLISFSQISWANRRRQKVICTILVTPVISWDTCSIEMHTIKDWQREKRMHLLSNEHLSERNIIINVSCKTAKNKALKLKLFNDNLHAIKIGWWINGKHIGR